MKFREYVGEKKIVETNIGPTEKEFLKIVARENPNGSRIDDKEFYLGFSISKKHLKRVFDYIKSWFLRYHIPFKPINPYLTLYLLKNLPANKGNLIRSIKEYKDDFLFSPIDKGSITFISGKPNLIQLEYSPNYSFMDDILKKTFQNENIRIVDEYCYIKLFRIEKIIDEKFLDEMMYSCPKFPKVNLGSIGLLRRRR